MRITFNCLPERATLPRIVRDEGIESIDIRFCRNDAIEGADETCVVVCAPYLAEFASIYGVTATGEVFPIHDADLNAVGADELAAACRAIFVAICNARRDPPDAAQRHQAE